MQTSEAILQMRLRMTFSGYPNFDYGTRWNGYSVPRRNHYRGSYSPRWDDMTQVFSRVCILQPRVESCQIPYNTFIITCPRAYGLKHVDMHSITRRVY